MATSMTSPPPPPSAPPVAPGSPGAPAPAGRGPGKQVRERRPLNTAKAIAIGLTLIAGLILSFGGYLFIGSALQASRAQDVMYKDLKEDLAQAVVPVSGILAPGTPLGLVQIPRLGVEQVFVAGSASELTMDGPGLQPDSRLPGQQGVSILIGRRATFGAPFAHLDEMQTGDIIVVTTGQGRFEYVVDIVRTSDAPPTKIEAVPARLSLVTSDPAMTPSRSLLVSAQLDGKALPASTGQASRPADQPGEGSKSSLVPLLLWSQLLLVVTCAFTWAALRVPGRALWIGAVPVFIALLWIVFENLAVLLPNTL